jgi:hypothetical protein
MYFTRCLLLAPLSLTVALPALHGVNDIDGREFKYKISELEKRQFAWTPDVEAIAGPIGFFMSLAAPLSRLLGIDIKGDMTTTLCKQFQEGSSTAMAVEAFAGSPNGKGPDERCVKDTSGGSGPYSSKVYEDPTLANHTIYIPSKPLGNGQKLPVIAWANGFCLPAGTMFENFLREVASFGYMVIANGRINYDGQLGDTTRHPELIKSIDWITKNPKPNGVLNEVDTNKIVIAGQSCGGVNVYGAINDTRIKYAMLFNSGDFAGLSSELIKSIKVPIAYFEGGKKDFASGPVSAQNQISLPRH